MKEILKFIEPQNYHVSLHAVSFGLLSEKFLHQEYFDYVNNLSSTERKQLHKQNFYTLLPITLCLIESDLYVKQIHSFYARRNWCTPSYLVFARMIRMHKVALRK